MTDSAMTNGLRIMDCECNIYDMADTIRVLSINARGLKNKLKRKAFFDYLKFKKCDLVCVQESHATEKDISVWEKQWGGKIIYEVGTEHSRGELILVSKHFSGEVKKEEKQDRILSASVETQELNFMLLNIYAPNASSSKKQFFVKLQHTLDKYVGKNVLVMGDFNCTLNSKLDIVSGLPHLKGEVDAFNNMTKNASLTDIWRLFHNSEKEYTWSKQQPFIARRLDYCFINHELVGSCSACEIIQAPSTDHKAIMLEINNSHFKRGPGYWRFNNSHLKDPLFLDHINTLLEDTLKENDTLGSLNPTDKWELCKIKIKDFCIEYGKYKAHGVKNKTLDLQTKLKTLDQLLISDPQNHQIQKDMIQTKHQLELLILEKARGAQIRAREKWIEEGEKNTKYFCSLEKSRAKKKVITRLENESGGIVTDQISLIKEQVNYFSKLYSQTTETENEEAVEKFIQNIQIPKLNDEEIAHCEGLITEHEASSAMMAMKNGSSPGSDGLTLEFFKVFWNKIKAPLIRSFNDSFNKGEMSYTQRQGIIILLHKGKDLSRDHLNNWRPITLSNTDYKILAKILAGRLCEVIPKLIHSDQVGYLKGRSISTILRTIDDVIEYLNQTNKAGYLLALDYSKAFDSISRNFILKAFKVFGFGEQYRKWIGILNSKTFSSINHGGWISQSFPVSCGIRQGCPLSPLAFILSVELLAIKIRECNIKGIGLPKQNDQIEPLKIKQLADDTTLFLQNKNDIMHARSILENFSSFSGLTLNQSKTKALKIGKNNEEEEIPFNVTDKIKILGVVFKNNVRAQDIEDNWVSRINKMKTIIKSWSARDLSLHGKIVIIKTFLISQYIFIMQSVGLPDKVLNEINRTLYKFLWQRKYSNRKAFEKVKRKVMESEYGKGGLKMINVNDLQTCFYLQWLGRLYKSDHENWSLIPKWHFSNLANEKSIFDINCKPSSLKGIENIKSDFWKKVICTYLENKTMDTFENININTFQNQLLWNNSLVLYKHKTLFFPEWKNKNIERIKDIVNVNESRLLTVEELQNILIQSPANTMFDYNAVINAIPKQWRDWISVQNNHTHIELKQECEVTKYNTKPRNILKIIQEQKHPNSVVKPCATGFWLRKCGVNVDDKVWLIPHLVTKEVRLKELQWKILHNIYPTNILLHKMKVTDDNKCYICRDVDFIEHFFYECPPVTIFWKKIESHINNLIRNKIKLSLNDILFGTFNHCLNKDEEKTVNAIILIGKMCISIAKKTKSTSPIYLIFEQQMSYRTLT